MNWRSIRFDWNQARAFLATAELGSFSAAARALGLTQPTLGRQVAGLEEELGLVLFERVGRSLALTGAGRDLLVHVRAMGEGAMGVSRTVAGHTEDLSGPVSVSVTDMFAARVMPRVAADLARIAPQVHLEVISSNTLSDLQRRDADIAIRHVRPEQPELTAKLVREVPAHFYAADSYWAQAGQPQSMADLAAHRFIAMGRAEEMMAYLVPLGFPVSEQNFTSFSDSGIVCWELCKRGLGITPMIADLAEETPGVARMTLEVPPFKVPYWLTVHREVHTSPRIRLVYDHLAQILGQKVLSYAG